MYYNNEVKMSFKEYITEAMTPKNKKKLIDLIRLIEDYGLEMYSYGSDETEGFSYTNSKKSADKKFKQIEKEIKDILTFKPKR